MPINQRGLHCTVREAALPSPVGPTCCYKRFGLLKVDRDGSNHVILGQLFSTDFTLQFCFQCTDPSAVPELCVFTLTTLGLWVAAPPGRLEIAAKDLRHHMHTVCSAQTESR